MINGINSVQQISLEQFDDLMLNYSEKRQSKQLTKENTLANEKLQKDSVKKQESKKVDYNDLAESIKSLLDDKSIAIEFAKDKDSNQMIMKIINDQTKEVIRQFPAEISLKIARIVSANATGKNIADVTI